MNKNTQKGAKTNMTLTERQQNILQLLKVERSAAVSDLATRLFVSETTIRRDLTEMKDLGLVERSHGGAILCENAEEISIFIRISENAKEKECAAGKALPHLPAFNSVFIDSSSTALALAERMDLTHKTVVTNNLQTAIQLSKKRDINLIVLGGSIQYNTVSATGSFTLRQLQDFSFDLMICSCASVKGTEIFERSLEQREIKSAAFAKSKARVLVYDSTKYDAYGVYRLAELRDFDLVATDREPPFALNDSSANLIY